MSNEQIVEHNFTHHPPKRGEVELYEEIRKSAKITALLVLDMCPPSRERSLAMTKLEEAVMWANASIARRV